MSTRNPLTPTERTKILNLRKSGVALAKIAQEMHRGKRTIVHVLNNSNITPKPTKTAEYKVLKVTPKKESKTFIRVDYNKPTTEKSPHKSTEVDEDYNKVPIEHRAVIKFFAKDGHNSREIHSLMKKVYKDATPNLPTVTYWARQFRKGRETILNESRSKVEDKKSPVKKIKVKKPMKDKIWVVRKKKSEPKKAKSASTLKLSKKDNTGQIKVKRPLSDKLKRSASTSKVKVKRIKEENKKNLLTFRFPGLKKLAQKTKS